MPNTFLRLCLTAAVLSAVPHLQQLQILCTYCVPTWVGSWIGSDGWLALGGGRWTGTGGGGWLTPGGGRWTQWERTGSGGGLTERFRWLLTWLDIDASSISNLKDSCPDHSFSPSGSSAGVMSEELLTAMYLNKWCISKKLDILSLTFSFTHSS